MSRIVKKLKNAVGGCSNKTHRESLLENDEFLFKRPEKWPIVKDQIDFDHNNNDDDDDEHDDANNDLDVHGQGHVYNDYDNLERAKTNQALLNSKAKKNLKDTTNTNYSRRFKGFFQSKQVEKSEDFNSKEGNKMSKEIMIENVEKTCNCPTKEPYYYEIQDFPSLFSDNHPLIELSKEPFKKSSMSDSKVNLFFKNENDEPLITCDHGTDNNHQAATSAAIRETDQQNLTDLRALDSFASRSDAIFWYLNLLHDHMVDRINQESMLKPNEKVKRTHVIAAHLLYSRNYYEMKTRSSVISVENKSRLDQMHPCVVALACLLDSDAVRVVDSHACSCDSYMYLFATRIKFCAWKTKLFVILKRPKRSSFERLNLIEDLTNCRKILQF